MQRVLFYFDYASPWAYLANELLPARLSGIDVSPCPVYLRGLETFAQGMPYTAAKLQYIARDLVRCTEHEGVRFTPPPVFPINGLYALRAALLAERDGVLARLHSALFRAAWAEARDVSNKAVVADLAREVGLAQVAEALDDPWAKAELKARTEAAATRGVFGVPTFVVGDELFWGHDRMEYVRRFASQAR